MELIEAFFRFVGFLQYAFLFLMEGQKKRNDMQKDFT